MPTTTNDQCKNVEYVRVHRNKAELVFDERYRRKQWVKKMNRLLSEEPPCKCSQCRTDSNLEAACNEKK